MVPLRMIVRHELCESAPKVTFTKEQHAVHALLFNRSHNPLGVRVAIGCARWDVDDPDALVFKERGDPLAPLGDRNRHEPPAGSLERLGVQGR